MSENRFRTPTRAELFQDMANNYKQYYLNDETAITDLSEGSELGTLLHSIAVELEALYLHDALLCDQKFVKTATGHFLDLLACENHLTRFEGTFAYTYCTFTLISNVRTKDFTVPAGTRIVHRKTGHKYILESPVTIMHGATQAIGKVVAEFPGSQYNAEKNTLTAFENVSELARVVSVNNYSEVTGGTDTETDEELRLRILDSKRNMIFGSVGWYRSQLEAKSGIHDVALLNPNNPNVNHQVKDGNGAIKKCTECTRVVCINFDREEITSQSEEEEESKKQSVMFSATAWLENNNNTVIGHKFHVMRAIGHPFYLEIYAYDNGTVTEEEIVQVLNAYFQGGSFTTDSKVYHYPGLNINDTVNKGAIIDALEKIPNIQQVDSVYKLKFYRWISNLAPQRTDEDLTKTWQWIPGTNRWSFTDNDGFTYYAKNIDNPDTSEHYYDLWGRKTFVEEQVDVDEYAYLGNMQEKYNNAELKDGEQAWYTNWSDVWYNPSYNYVIYHSLGSATKDNTYYTDLDSNTPTDSQ